MKTRKELIRNIGYIQSALQMSVFDDVSKYYKLRNFKSFKELAEDLDITPNKARTIMNGNFNGNMVDLVKIYWKIGKKVELKITDFKDLK